MRKQTKRFLSMTLSAALTLSLASGLGYNQESVASAEDAATTTTAGAVTSGSATSGSATTTSASATAAATTSASATAAATTSASATAAATASASATAAATEAPVATKGVVIPAYIDKALWETEGMHAYLFYQADGTWDYRNAYAPLSDYAEKDSTECADSYWFIKAGGSEVSADAVKVTDVLLTGDGDYSVSITGIDLSGSTKFNMLGVATDINSKEKPSVSMDKASIKIDGKAVQEGLSLTAKVDDYESGKYTFMAINAWADTSKESDPVQPAEISDLPTDSLEISFTVSGLSGSSTTKKAPAKGKTFTDKNFKYKVTKAASGKKAGTVTVVGLTKKGKKAKTLKLAASATKVKKFTITAIGKKAFKGAKATSITLNKKITKIPASAFASCKKLKKLTLKAKLKSVKKNAFKGCKKTITVKGTAKKANVKKLKKSGYKKFK